MFETIYLVIYILDEILQNKKVKLENIRGMQYPNIQAMETSELKIYLDDVFEAENEDFAISEIRLLGMELP